MIKSMHTCQYCKKSYSQKSALNRHERTTRFCMKLQEEKGKSIDPSIFLYCKLCNREFTNKKNLIYHENICGKKTVTKEEKKQENKREKEPESDSESEQDPEPESESLVPVDDIEVRINRKLKVLKTELDETKERLQTLTIKHISSLKNHKYVKFNNDKPCFYIIESDIPCNDCGSKTNLQYKFGIAGTSVDQKNNTIDKRLQSHRTLWPRLKVRFLLFIKDAILIEKNFKMMYDTEINPNGHEIVTGVPLKNITDRLEKLLGVLCTTHDEYHITPEKTLKKYNDYVETTVKPSV